MTSGFEKSTAAQPTQSQDDPWVTATLPPDSSQNAWLVSYIDILMLLTTLLVVLLTLQKATPQKRATVMKATKVVARVQTYPHRIPPTVGDEAIRYSPERSPDRSRLEQVPLPLKRLPPERSSKAALPSAAPALHPSEKESDLSEAKAVSAPDQVAEPASKTVPWDMPDDLKEQVEIIREAEHIRLEVNGTILFESGSADLKVQGAALLQKLAAILKRHRGRISVEGHTDDRPITTARYPSNWELSAARASTVARYLIVHGIVADRLRAIGYADTRPRSQNHSAAGRARNRRVTLVMYLPQT